MKKLVIFCLLIIPFVLNSQGQNSGSGDDEGVIIWCNGQPSKLTPAEAAAFRQQAAYTIVDEMPAFEGGEESRMKFLTKTFKYPIFAMEQRVQGSVQISFVITRDGCIANPKVVKGVGGGCDEEALRVVQQMPRWIPGKLDGENVSVQYKMNLNINQN